jgi:hypothetical protein
MGWDDLVDAVAVAHPEAKVSQMFGAPCVKRDTGKVAFCSWQGAVVFKLVDESARTDALALEGAELFDPGMGRRMREWVLVPAAHSGRWPELAERSLAG